MNSLSEAVGIPIHHVKKCLEAMHAASPSWHIALHAQPSMVSVTGLLIVCTCTVLSWCYEDAESLVLHIALADIDVAGFCLSLRLSLSLLGHWQRGPMVHNILGSKLGWIRLEQQCLETVAYQSRRLR